MSRRDDPLYLGNQLCFAVYSATHAFNRVYKPLLDPLGLTYPQYLVMLVLWDRDEVLVKEIGAQLHLDSGTLTPLLKRLEAAGLVRRQRDPMDERQVRITLTEAGQALRQRAKSVPRDVLCATGQTVEDLAAMKTELLQLRDRLNAMAEGGAA